MKITIFLSLLFIVFGNEAVKAQGPDQTEAIHIPDPVLAAILLANVDNNGDGSISQAEAETLTNLSLPDAGISDLTGLAHFSNLQTINLRSNQIVDLEPISQLAALTRIDVSSNRIRSLPQETHWPVLDRLDLSRNQLSQIPSLSAWPALTSLYVDGNAITILPDMDGSNLTLLNCGFNQLTQLPALPSSLVTLFANVNQLTSVPDLNLLPNLVGLGLAGNQISDLSPILPFSDRLTSLYFDGNPIAEIPDMALFSNMDNLGYGSTVLESLPSIAMMNLTSLKVAGPTLTSWPTLPANLTSLNVCCNDLEGLPPLPENLQRLTISNMSNLEEMPPIHGMLELEDLIVTHSGLRILPTLPASTTRVTVIYSELEILPNLESNHQLRHFNLTNNQISEINPLGMLPAGLGLGIFLDNNLIIDSPGNCDVIGDVLNRITSNMTYHSQGDPLGFWEEVSLWQEGGTDIRDMVLTLRWGAPGPRPYAICE